MYKNCLNNKLKGEFKMLIYKLEVEITGNDWERTEYYFFKSYDEREEFKKKYKKEHIKNGEYIPTISSIHCFDEDTVFNTFNSLINSLSFHIQID